MSKGTTIKDALQKWEEKAGAKAPDALEVTFLSMNENTIFPLHCSLTKQSSFLEPVERAFI